MADLSKFLVFNKCVDDEELHHSGKTEKEVVWGTIALALLLALVWWALFAYFTPKTAIVVSVVIGIAIILRFCVYFPRRDRREAGVVTEQQ